MRARVDAFVRARWMEQVSEEAAWVEQVRRQTEQCLESVGVPSADGAHTVQYGFVGPTWQRTVEVLAQTELPPLLLFHGTRATWADVQEADVAALQERVRTDMVLRLQLLDVCAAGLEAARAGQAWLHNWLASARWRREGLKQPAPHALIPTWVTKVHGEVELEFASLASQLPPATWPHLYAWLIHYLAASAREGTFTPLLVPLPARAAAETRQQLAEWLGEHWCTLARLSTSWQQDVGSTSALAALLPPTSCPTLADFVSCIDSLATPAAPAQPSPPSRPPATAPETWVCTTVQSSLFPAMYLSPAGQLSFNVSAE